MGFDLYANSLSFFRFCLIWALVGFNIGQNIGGMLTKFLPARQINLGSSLASLRGKHTFGKRTQAKIGHMYFLICSISDPRTPDPKPTCLKHFTRFCVYDIRFEIACIKQVLIVIMQSVIHSINFMFA